MTKVLFVCVGNSGRSVLAEHLLRADGGGAHDARSAGAHPEQGVEPRVVEVLGELGIDASGHVPRQLTPELTQWADVIVAACDGVCEPVQGKRFEGWQLPDPWVMSLDQVRALRDDVRVQVAELLKTL